MSCADECGQLHGKINVPASAPINPPGCLAGTTKRDMKLIVFTGQCPDAVQRLKAAISTLSSEMEVDYFSTVDALSTMLRRFHQRPLLAVMLAADQDELRNILLLKDALADIPMILILPDREPETISTGTQFHPRFISYVDGDFKDVLEVLALMVQKLT